MTKRFLIVCMAAALFLTCFAAVMARWGGLTSPPSHHRYERLRLGMTRQEVVTTLGVPPGNYDTRAPLLRGAILIHEAGCPRYSLPAWGRFAPTNQTESIRMEEWRWSDDWIDVAFNEHGIVIGYYLFDSSNPIRPPPQTIFERVRSWFGF
jgi:hypothetical protein